MKNIITLAFLIFGIWQAAAQHPDQNWMIERTFTDNSGSSVTDIVYLDGLGRPEQIINVGASPNSFNIVTPFVNRGQLSTEQYLPFASRATHAGRLEDALGDQMRFYASMFPGEAAENRPFVEYKHEASPLKRLTELYNVGKDFAPNGKKTTISYGSNSSEDNVCKIKLQTRTNGLEIGLYEPNTLYKATLINEDGGVTVIFKNNTGQIILERTTACGSLNYPLDTYYVYDVFGNLVWIIPPGANSIFEMDIVPDLHPTVQDFCYLWKYNSEGQLISSKNPGQAALTYTYNDKRKLTEYSNGEQKVGLIYDKWGRITNKTYHYKNGSGGNVVVTMEDYVYDTRRIGARSFEAVPGVAEASDVDNRIKGLMTYESALIFDEKDVANVQRDIYYDYMARPIQIVEFNHLKGISRTSIKYTFNGQVQRVHESHQAGLQVVPDIMTRSYDYDHRGRIRSETTRLNSEPEVVITYEYDELGHMISKNYGSVATESYNYNIQGQLTRINNEQFKMDLRYHDAELTAGSYTGNITEWEWEHKGTTLPLKTYSATYDKLNRLSQAILYENGERINENLFNYDGNGNLVLMQKEDRSVWTRSLKGNQTKVLTVKNIPYSFGYDSRGNMTRDGYDSLNIKYNFLNLTQSITHDNGSKVNYSWTASGSKVRALNADKQGYEYLGSLVYTRNGNDISLESAGFSSGRLLPNDVHFHLTDHLGSPRVILNKSGTEMARYDYSPYGEASNPTGQASTNRYLFNGKESQFAFGVNYNDHGLRMYSPQMGSWTTVDPLAAQAPQWSPYRAFFDSPFNYIDPFGLFESRRDARIWRRENGVNGRVRRNDDGSFRVDERGTGISYFIPAPDQIDDMTQYFMDRMGGAYSTFTHELVGKGQRNVLRTFDILNPSWFTNRSLVYAAHIGVNMPEISDNFIATSKYYAFTTLEHGGGFGAKAGSIGSWVLGGAELWTTFDRVGYDFTKWDGVARYEVAMKTFALIPVYGSTISFFFYDIPKMTAESMQRAESDFRHKANGIRKDMFSW